jgi:hypothetical protein
MLRAIAPYCKYLLKAYCVALITTRDAGGKRRTLRSNTPTSSNLSRKVLLMKGLHTTHTFYRSALRHENERFNFAMEAKCVKKSPSLLTAVLRNLQNCDRMQ